MNKEEEIRGALISLVEGRESIVFDKIQNDIDYFFEKYGVLKWLSPSQSAIIRPWDKITLSPLPWPMRFYVI
jgi:hypothetical protein